MKKGNQTTCEYQLKRKWGHRDIMVELSVNERVYEERMDTVGSLSILA